LRPRFANRNDAKPGLILIITEINSKTEIILMRPEQATHRLIYEDNCVKVKEETIVWPCSMRLRQKNKTTSFIGTAGRVRPVGLIQDCSYVTEGSRRVAL
jgi:hypothetical protein